jgi:outer membrane protein assembly factor BamB
MKAILWMFALMMAAASGASAAATAGQNITTIHYLASPNITWTSSISPLLKGNGIFLSPDDHILVSTSLDGTVNSFHPSTGAILWTHQPVPINNSLLSCHSGVTFSSNGSFFIYSVIDNEGSPSEMTYVF